MPGATAPGAIKAPVIRAIRELPGDDPFDLANERVAINRIAASTQIWRDLDAEPSVRAVLLEWDIPDDATATLMRSIVD